MTSKKGLKLHSIIEKLSEQFVRVNPTDDPVDEEDPDIVTVNMQPPQQRKTSRNKRATTRQKRQKRQKQSTKVKKGRTTTKRKAIDNAKKSSKKRITREHYQPAVDDDLCIDVNAVLNIVPQVQDIDKANVHVAHHSWPLKKNVCKVCFQQLRTKEELLNHVKQLHSDAFQKLPVDLGNDKDNGTVIVASSMQNEEQRRGGDEDEEIDVEGIDEENIGENVNHNHHNVDPDFEVDSSIVSDVSSEDMPVSKYRQKRRSARIEAMKVSKDTDSKKPEKNDSDIHLDVARIMNTKPKLKNIELPTTKEVACMLCEEKFYFQMELDNHNEERHSEIAANNRSEGIADCEHCGREFLTRKGLFLHIRKLVHKIERGERTEEDRRKRREQERTCRECGKVFKDFVSLREHYMIHSDESPFKCNLCDKTFKDKNYVTRHMQIHSGVKKYECKYCKKLFAHSGTLRSHVMLHTGERPFKCQYCETGFISKFELRVHENRHTGNMPFKCPYCPKGFPKSNNLKMHLTSHSSDKPFLCEVCGKGFKRRDHLRYHRYIHLETKPYKCNTCNKTFSQHVCLRKHLPCRELEKRANKLKEDGPKKQKGDKKSHKDKQVILDAGDKTSSKATMTADQEKEPDLHPSDRRDIEDNTVSEQEVTSRNTYSVAATIPQNTKKPKANQGKEETQPRNNDKDFSPCIVGSIPSAQQEHYDSESHVPASNVNPVQSIDTELALASLIGRDYSNTTGQHHSVDNVDFHHEYRNPSHRTSTPSVRSLPPAQRLPETCVCSPSMHQAFVPFHCSSQSAPAVEYILETLPSSNRSYAQETSNELSSALLAAMDPDNLSSMVENTTAFYPPT